MGNLTLITKLAMAIWPLVVTLLALFYRKKQSSNNPWTGGPISWPKAFWLSYTIQTWFFLPFFFLIPYEVPSFLKTIIIFHLISWWVRGILELFMIYKWLNWSPRYGISHDVFHIAGLIVLMLMNKHHLSEIDYGSHNFAILAYIYMLFVTTAAEISFAFLFLSLRTFQESRENVYFASDDPKWVFVNRYTLTIVTIAFMHLFFQSWYALTFL
jgi:hypothetical protein